MGQIWRGHRVGGANMAWASSGCGKYGVGIEWVWQIWRGHRVGVANMAWASSGCSKYGVGIEWV